MNTSRRKTLLEQLILDGLCELDVLISARGSFDVLQWSHEPYELQHVLFFVDEQFDEGLHVVTGPDRRVH